MSRLRCATKPAVGPEDAALRAALRTTNGDAATGLEGKRNKKCLVVGAPLNENYKNYIVFQSDRQSTTISTFISSAFRLHWWRYTPDPADVEPSMVLLDFDSSAVSSRRGRFDEGDES